MVRVFAELRRVLRHDGTLWLNIGDSYYNYRPGGTSQTKQTLAGHNGAVVEVSAKRNQRFEGIKEKDLCMIPARVALALQDDGWWLRSQIVWAKRAPMPESVTDRPTSAWESIFLLTKSARYFYDSEAVKEALESTPEEYLRAGKSVRENHAYGEVGGTPLGSKSFATMPSGRNQRNVWHLSPEPYSEAHFATFPTEIPRRAILAGTSAHGCCSTCGAPWRRVVERSKYEPEEVSVGVRRVDDSRGDKTRKLSGKEYNASVRVMGATWQPTCTCGGEPVPATVLDPFAGSGTTLAVALSLGRHAIGIELNPEYAELAHKRITTTQPALIGL